MRLEGVFRYGNKAFHLGSDNNRAWGIYPSSAADGDITIDCDMMCAGASDEVVPHYSWQWPLCGKRHHQFL